MGLPRKAKTVVYPSVPDFCQKLYRPTVKWQIFAKHGSSRSVCHINTLAWQKIPFQSYNRPSSHHPNSLSTNFSVRLWRTLQRLQHPWLSFVTIRLCPVGTRENVIISLKIQIGLRNDPGLQPVTHRLTVMKVSTVNKRCQDYLYHCYH